MTLKEIRDSFLAEYEIETQKRDTKPLTVNDKMIALWMSEAQQDIIDRLGMSKSFVDVVISPGTNTYSLLVDFGRIEKIMLSGKPLQCRSMKEIDSTGPSGDGVPSYYAIYYDEGYKLVIAPEFTQGATIRIWYVINTNYYQHSIGANQSWGTFDGSDFTGYTKMPEKYGILIKFYLLSKVITEFKEYYEMELMKMKQISASETDAVFEYTFPT